MKVFPLIEGHFSVDRNKNFSILETDSKGIKMSIQPFLIQIDHENILLDAGLGWLENNTPKIIQNLRNINLHPKDVSKILISHLHKDHINGLVNTSMGQLELIFPDAEVFIQKREYEYALNQIGSLSYDFEILDFIIKNSKINWLNENHGYVTKSIRYEITPGHTPFLQSFWIEGEKIVFYGSDNLPLEYYLKYNAAYKSDYNGKEAMQYRILWEKEAKENQWEILLYHDLEKASLQF